MLSNLFRRIATARSMPLSCDALRGAAMSTQARANNRKGDDREVVSVLKLNMLHNNPGARKAKRRIGRGIGSSKGKTSGRGHKGQKARSGTSFNPSFEGGQTPFFKLVPKRGFNNKNHAQPMLPVNVGTLQDFVDMGRLIPTGDSEDTVDGLRTITIRDLVDAGMCTKSSIKHGVKLLADGKDRLRSPLRLHVSRASKEAIQAVEGAGGEVTTVHYNRLALRALLSPEKWGMLPLPKRARPPPKFHAYYTDWHGSRGYLSVQAQMRDFLFQDRPDLQDRFEQALQKQLEKSELEEHGKKSSAEK